MIVRVLAQTPDCRNGNCPTVLLTDRGTVVVQGYAIAPHGEAEHEAGAVWVPEDILVRAARAIADQEPGAPRMPRPRDGHGLRVEHTGQGTFRVAGDATTADVVDLVVPDGEAAVEVTQDELLQEVALMLRSTKEAV